MAHTKRKGVIMKKGFMLYALGFMGLQAADAGMRITTYPGKTVVEEVAPAYPPLPLVAGYPSAPAALNLTGYTEEQIDAAILVRHQQQTNASPATCFRSGGSVPVTKVQHSSGAVTLPAPTDSECDSPQPARLSKHQRQRSQSENDIRKASSIETQIQQLPSLSQAPMLKLLTAALQLQQLVDTLVEAHYKSVQELESTPGTNTLIRKAAEGQLPKARERIDTSTRVMRDATKAITVRLEKAKK